MKIIIAGASGFVGKRLTSHLSKTHSIQTVGRGDGSHITWDPQVETENKELNEAISKADVVINLCGAGIADKKWTDEYKKILTESRVSTNNLLAKSIKAAKNQPKLFISASGTPYKHNSGGSSEDSELADGFLANLVRKWEESAMQVQSKNTRVVCVRTGVVLDESGGFLKKISLPFKLGLGGKIGSGNQVIPWISLEDLVNIYAFIIENDVEGCINAAAPTMTLNEKFTKSYGRHVNRPTILPTPVFALKLIYGEELVWELMLKNNHVVPKKLLELGYIFHHNSIDKFFKKDKTAYSNNK